MLFLIPISLLTTSNFENSNPIPVLPIKLIAYPVIVALWREKKSKLENLFTIKYHLKVSNRGLKRSKKIINDNWIKLKLFMTLKIILISPKKYIHKLATINISPGEILKIKL